MQRIIGGSDGQYRFLELPDPDEWLMPGVRWGSFEHALTPAFWVSQAWLVDAPDKDFRLCATLVEEVVTCLLGGHGAPAEIGLAASARVVRALAETQAVTLPEERIFELLSEPLDVRGRKVRYRFAAQRSRYLAGSLAGLQHIVEDELEDVALRAALCTLPGIGPKTASWIVRNRRASDDVAILDVHIVRACEHMGVFPEGADPARRYLDLESRFIEFCRRGQARASVVDEVMWSTMRKLNRAMLKLLVDRELKFDDRQPLLAWGETACQAAVAAVGTTETTHQRVRT